MTRDPPPVGEGWATPIGITGRVTFGPTGPGPPRRRGGAARSLVETHRGPDGARVSLIRRPDGSTLTVVVSASAMGDESGASDGTEAWIREGARREPPASALWRLARLVAATRVSRPGVPEVRPGPALRST